MSTLSEIEAAADSLPPEQKQKGKQKLLLFGASRLRRNGARVPAPRQFAAQEIASWMVEDEANLKRFQEAENAILKGWPSLSPGLARQRLPRVMPGQRQL